MPALAGGAAPGRVSRRAGPAECCAAVPAAVFIPSGSLLPEEPPALSPPPPARRPRGFVYGLCLFSEAPAAPAPPAVAQPRAGGNLKPRGEAGAPAAPPRLSPPRSLPAPRRRSCHRRESKARRSGSRVPSSRSSGAGENANFMIASPSCLRGIPAPCPTRSRQLFSNYLLCE
ncbi:PREDICTED: proline-rich receptor-like protein kinase PERK2 [Hipposideros armiger]|uniref:Proline-rich receptor-like protein kinase PERK2 n=1 Tax=Hipposideros armiger TaxID=186990 RepID=A0A8B7QGZ7_HIPAR|nr:PREDICTED: proline-rich receptor-like protein kinase PERK2 [Hipposideros armiger]